LTKPLATTLAVLKLVALGSLRLDVRLAEVLPDFKSTDKAVVKIEHLLYHTAGLPDYRPYYLILEKLPLSERPAALRDLLVREPRVAPIGERSAYSDVGFMILQWLVEAVGGQGLDNFVREWVHAPLGIDDLGYIPLDGRPRPRVEFAATERCPWRGCVLKGAVHDENAYVMGGVAGHAGLFGTAAAVHKLLAALVSIHDGRSKDEVLPRALLRLAFTRPFNGHRALGFDCPAATAASCGSRFSERTIGHLGFTGTSFWVDLAGTVIVILLTNRVHPSRTNEAIKPFRPVLHDAVMEALWAERKTNGA
jgi:CubicO group peptidase (beta-lactamase class C family)